MNQLLPTIPQAREPGISGNHFIGVVVLDLALDSGTPFALQLFSGAVKLGMSLDGMEPINLGGLFGQGFLVCLVEVEDQRRAVHAVHAAIKALELLPLSVIASFDGGEGCWRTMHPEGGADFGSFLSETYIKAAQERIAVDRAFIASVIRAVQQAKGDTLGKSKPGDGDNK